MKRWMTILLSVSVAFAAIGLGEGFANLLMLAVLGMSAVFVLRPPARRNAPAEAPMRYADAEGAAQPLAGMPQSDIREFAAPEVFAGIRLQMDERGDARQRTDIVMLNAKLPEVATEGERHIADVRFGGLIREEKDNPARPFDELRNLGKSVDDSRGWAVAGIQRVG